MIHMYYYVFIYREIERETCVDLITKWWLGMRLVTHVEPGELTMVAEQLQFVG